MTALMKANDVATPSMIIRECRKFIKHTDSELAKDGRTLANKINGMLTAFNFMEKSHESGKAIDAGMRLFNATDDGDYFRARCAGENIIKACEDSERKENEF